MLETSKEGLHKIVKTVASPLRFFVVAIIMLTFIVVGLATSSKLPPEMTVAIIYIAFIAFIVLIVIVTILLVFFPKKLTFDQEAHLTVMRERLGDSELPFQYIPGELPSVERNETQLLEANSEGK